MIATIYPDRSLEISRLLALLPVEWDSKTLITVINSSPGKTWLGKQGHPVLATHKKNKHDFVIAIDFQRWQYFEEDARNLLWWHELAMIQQHSIKSDRSTMITGVIGLTIAAEQLISQDIVVLSISLTVAGLASFQYYQSRQGEWYRRQVAKADQGAIKIAQQFGYSSTTARAILRSTLKTLATQVTIGQFAKVYRMRIQVLDICNQELSNPPRFKPA